MIRPRGFTLVELMVAFSVAVTLIILMTDIFRSGSKMFESASWRQIKMGQTQVAMRRFFTDLEQASNHNEIVYKQISVCGETLEQSVPTVSTSDRNLQYVTLIKADDCSESSKVLTFEIVKVSIGYTMTDPFTGAEIPSDTAVSKIKNIFVCSLYLHKNKLLYQKKVQDEYGAFSDFPGDLLFLDEVYSVACSHTPIMDNAGKTETRSRLDIAITLTSGSNSNNRMELKRSCNLNVKAVAVSAFPIETGAPVWSGP